MPHNPSRTSQPEWYRLAVRYRAGIMRDLQKMEEHRCRPDSVHLIRTRCRRLQALLELLGEKEQASAVARAVSKLSRLRTLQVFRRYLRSADAPRKDLCGVKDRIDREEARLRSKQVFIKLGRLIWKHALPQAGTSNLSLAARRPFAQQRHVNRLEQLVEKAVRKPRRKHLHALRLELKQVRYQTEWLPGGQDEKSALVNRLKSVQNLLGRYEEFAAFRRWARNWDLTLRDRIDRDWKRARKRARAVPGQLSWLLNAPADGPIWFSRDRPGPLLTG